MALTTLMPTSSVYRQLLKQLASQKCMFFLCLYRVLQNNESTLQHKVLFVFAFVNCCYTVHCIIGIDS
jgi:hypothetical protein